VLAYYLATFLCLIVPGHDLADSKLIDDDRVSAECPVRETPRETSQVYAGWLSAARSLPIAQTGHPPSPADLGIQRPASWRNRTARRSSRCRALAADRTIPVAELGSLGLGAARCRALLDRVSRKQDGTAAAANTANRKRAVLNNLMQYGIEVGALSANPLKAVKWTRPRTVKTVDPRTVVNSDQARRLLAAVGQQGELGERMVAFFGCLYYAALRPEEAVDLRRDNLASLPDHGWGELVLTNSEPRSGTWWTDSGSARQRRELKHRPRGETRPVPVHPELVALLNQHLKNYAPGPDGRVFIGPRGGIFNDRAYLKIFHKARAAAFIPRESTSLLARRPYDLRHAAVSTWLNAGVPAPQVADWAGHSVDVLLRVYARCISGQQAEAKRRIEEATRPRYDE